ncbi:phosphoglycerate kinase [Thermodesulforhabdus norvegica]|uniref:Phosphoglycerate kinase n=1 Tax=Thermodesulforhabdus norvegica TaxID=39841 RepID=A0A1I4VK25_9BACT|nr:phosphoglycerate kinase [Thermodesulforhabdus norvegica]SFN01376.1 phosphoglycerate kinase [Thermodesulforhabdus norvegica]
MKTLDDVNLEKKVVFLRADFNVPLDENRRVADDTRIKATLPTIERILQSGAKLLVASHLGRPKGKVVPELSLKPVADHLSGLLGNSVLFVEDCVGEKRNEALSKLKHGDLALLENLRFHEGETKNDPEFARSLAEGVDLYVNDAFAVSHRAHASVHAIIEYVPECAAGYQLYKELDYYHRALETPERPVAIVIGGAKVSTKIGVLENLLSRCNIMIIGGAMANTFMKALGRPVGASQVEDDYIETAREFLKRAQELGVEVHLPVDAVAAPSIDAEAEAMEVSLDNIPENLAIFDVGPRTVELFREAIEKASTVVWNGPMGVFEKPAFARGTMELAKAIAEHKGLTVAGGGDTVSALNEFGLYDKVGYVSTGGGAFLELLEGKALPGVEALERCGK